LDPSGPSRQPPRVLSVVVVNQRREVARLARLVDQFGEECGLSEDATASINLMLDEVVSNVIKYGFSDALEHEIYVSVVLEDDFVTLEIADDGRPFNPLEAPQPNLDVPIEDRPIGGLGIFIVKSTADALDYCRENGRNIMTMKKRI
jgi:anti-sigma regulatory factor (Ser/Thr protein kinase)